MIRHKKCRPLLPETRLLRATVFISALERLLVGLTCYRFVTPTAEVVTSAVRALPPPRVIGRQL